RSGVAETGGQEKRKQSYRSGQHAPLNTPRHGENGDHAADHERCKGDVDRAPMAIYAAINRSPHVPVTAKVEARFLLLEYAG
ncbi:hypothetical protein ACC730_38030, partial [Rhizobium ruizarguesonis]